MIDTRDLNSLVLDWIHLFLPVYIRRIGIYLSGHLLQCRNGLRCWIHICVSLIIHCNTVRDLGWNQMRCVRLQGTAASVESSSNSRWSFLLILPLVFDRPSIFLPRTTSWVVTMNSSYVPPLCGTDDNNVKTVCCHKKEQVFEYTKTILFFTPGKKGCFWLITLYYSLQGCSVLYWRKHLTTLSQCIVFIIFPILFLEQMIDSLAELITWSGRAHWGSRVDWNNKWCSCVRTNGTVLLVISAVNKCRICKNFWT